MENNVKITFNPNETFIKVKYKAGKFRDGREYPSVDEKRPLTLLNADLQTLFTYTGANDIIPNPERSRPRQELVVSIIMRNIITPKPWEEAWISFWRDHFSIFGNDQNVGAFSPHWEEQVIRKHSWGNFREMLEAVASHPAMLYYLNNRSSRAGSANENFARELFELHTFGKNAYFNSIYSDWKKVPGALEGKATGYIDEDVYEAARAFTGWTVNDGSNIGNNKKLPETGDFTYVELRHDNYQKRVLGIELPSYSGSMVDGRKVLDICSFHSATAHHIAEKLVRRFISDTPPQKLIESTAALFLNQKSNANQLKNVFNHLVKEAALIPDSNKQKIMAPIRLASKFISLTNIPFKFNDEGFLRGIEGAGFSPYSWPSPDGIPDSMVEILSPGFVKERISLIQGLAENWWQTGEFDPFSEIGSNASFEVLMSFWEMKLFGKERLDLRNQIFKFGKINPNEKANNPQVVRKMIGLLACTPTFQTEVVLPKTII
jgi:uncharacterized protein (DUF1800 family)